MFILEMYDIYVYPLRSYLNACYILVNFWRHDVYFLNNCIIRVFYRLIEIMRYIHHQDPWAKPILQVDRTWSEGDCRCFECGGLSGGRMRQNAFLEQMGGVYLQALRRSSK